MRALRFGLLATAASIVAVSAQAQTAAPAETAPAAQPAAQPAAESSGMLEEIVVTAQKRAENLQDTPIAISAYTGETLTNMGITNVSEVAQNSPSLYSAPYPSSSNTITLYIRGLGVNDPMQITKDGAVGVYLDGFYLSRPQTSTVDLADVERVEILRGPQGTLYGRNTTGGAVNVISRKPSGELDLRSSLSIGNRDHLRSLTNVDLPAFGDFAVKFTLLASNRDGWVENSGSGNNYNKEEQLAGRAAVRWTPTDNFTVDYAFDKGKVESTPIYYVNPSLVGVIPGYNANPRRTWRPIDLPESETEVEGHSLTIEWEASDNLTLRSLSGIRDLSFAAYQDYAESFGVGFLTFDDMDSRQYTQELQAVGSFGERIEYVAGLYYFREKADHFQHNDITTPFGPIDNDRTVDALSKSKAAYAQVTWTPPVLDDRLDLTVGARYTDDSRKATRDLTSVLEAAPGFLINLRPPEAGVSNKQSFNRFNPAFTANFRATDDITVYGKVATGYRAGGSNESGLNFTRTFDPEKVTSYEVGLKSDWFERRLRVNLAGFIMDYKDLQLDTSPVEADRSITDTVNAGKAKVKGFEADVTLVPFEGLTLTASYAYLDQKLSDIFVEAGSEFDPNTSPLAASLGYRLGQDISGRYVLSFAPKHSVSLAADWTFLQFDSGDLAAHVDYQWKDDAFMTAGAGPDVVGRDFYILPARGLLDARLTYTHELNDDRELRFALWGRNITDKRYKAHVIGNGDIVQGYISQTYAIAEPASYGIEIAVDF